jgi:tRNA-Thr(GGU) m(6)t(6)A37 methyltransferase TsaA
MKIQFEQIGHVESPWKTLTGMPIQPSGARGVEGRIVLREEFAEGLFDIDGFSHLILLYHLHRVSRFKLLVTPFLDSTPRGIFATRAPLRPNPIGLSIVRLLSHKRAILHVQDVDILDGTPLIDIKPWVSDFDAVSNAHAGWYENARRDVRSYRSDSRFQPEVAPLETGQAAEKPHGQERSQGE